MTTQSLIKVPHYSEIACRYIYISVRQKNLNIILKFLFEFITQFVDYFSLVISVYVFFFLTLKRIFSIEKKK